MISVRYQSLVCKIVITPVHIAAGSVRVQAQGPWLGPQVCQTVATPWQRPLLNQSESNDSYKWNNVLQSETTIHPDNGMNEENEWKFSHQLMTIDHFSLTRALWQSHGHFRKCLRLAICEREEPFGGNLGQWWNEWFVWINVLPLRVAEQCLRYSTR